MEDSSQGGFPDTGRASKHESALDSQESAPVKGKPAALMKQRPERGTKEIDPPSTGVSFRGGIHRDLSPIFDEERNPIGSSHEETTPVDFKEPAISAELEKMPRNLTSAKQHIPVSRTDDQFGAVHLRSDLESEGGVVEYPVT